MKTSTLAVAIILSLGLTAGFVYANGAPQAEKGVIVGQVIEISTYAMKGLGEDTSEAHKNRIELGFPVAILEEDTGTVWVCVYRNPAPASAMTTANDVLAPYAAQKVAAQGLKYEANGVSVIRVSIVSEY